MNNKRSIAAKKGWETRRQKMYNSILQFDIIVEKRKKIINGKTHVDLICRNPTGKERELYDKGKIGAIIKME